MGTSGGYMYPGATSTGGVYRDATMNPQYPVRTDTSYSTTGIVGHTGRVDSRGAVWATAPVHHQPV